MSSLFVTAPEGDDPTSDLPERPVSTHPNFVTAEGLARIELALAREQRDWDVAKAAGDKTALERIGRELRYWIARRGTAQVVAAPPDARRVHFGSTVTVEGGDGGRQTWRIVGEDEADPDQGTLSYVSLLAQALVSRRAGETVPLGDTRIEILSID